jgi:hypothetical protein
MNYPFFLGPEDHRLGDYYKTLNRWGFILMPLLFALNELFVRPNLSIYKASPDRLWSIVALTLNAQIPVSMGVRAYLVIALFMMGLAAFFLMLPKWGPRATRVGMKSGLPTYSEYKSAYFQIENQIHRTVFFVWHRVLMRIAFFIGICSLCTAINLFRSLL